MQAEPVIVGMSLTPRPGTPGSCVLYSAGPVTVTVQTEGAEEVWITVDDGEAVALEPVGDDGTEFVGEISVLGESWNGSHTVSAVAESGELVKMRFVAVVLAVALALVLIDARFKPAVVLQTAMFVVACRLFWAVLHWMGRYHVLTDLRVLSLSGVFAVEVFDCPLRKVASVEHVYTVREPPLCLGTLAIRPADGAQACLWQSIRRPVWVRERLLAAIARANQNFSA